MTKDEAVAKIVTLVPLSEADVRAFLECTDDERALIIQSAKDAGTIPSPGAWAAVVDVLKLCGEIASLVLPVTGLVTGIYNVSKL